MLGQRTCVRNNGLIMSQAQPGHSDRHRETEDNYTPHTLQTYLLQHASSLLLYTLKPETRLIKSSEYISRSRSIYISCDWSKR